MTAIQIVASHGLKRLNLGNLVRQVELVPSAIYHHLENKNQVIEAVIDLIRDMLSENVIAVCK